LSSEHRDNPKIGLGTQERILLVTAGTLHVLLTDDDGEVLMLTLFAGQYLYTKGRLKTRHQASSFHSGVDGAGGPC
jgi:hypothetical protein